MKIKVKRGLEIGDGCPPFIIAEVGSNWINLADCLTSIEMAESCGADAVKFQLFSHTSLYGFNEPEFNINQLPGVSPYLDPMWIPRLKDRANQVGIEFMCSAFSPEQIDFVDPFVSLHKLASAEMCHIRMLEKLRRIGKPVLMSTGAHTIEEIDQAKKLLGEVPLVLMYCVSAYPAREVNLDNIDVLRNRFGTLCGYSDHSLDVLEVPSLAVQMGACVVEKHFTAIGYVGTDDSGHSLNPFEFDHMSQAIRGTLNASIGPTREELGMIDRSNRRLVAIMDIENGDPFIENVNFGIFRSLKDDPEALSPFLIESLRFSHASRLIKRGEGITLESCGT